MTTPPLLTLHTEHFDRLTPHPGISTGHWLVQDAIEAEVITWDHAVWGELIFTVGIEDYEFVVGYSVTGEVYLSRAAKVDIPHPGNPSLDPLEDNDRYPPLPDPLQQPAEFLRLVVDELNALHEASNRMVAVWPGNTGVPVLPHHHTPRPGFLGRVRDRREITMVERSHIEKQLYDAIKHGIRPNESELEAIVGGESVPRSPSPAVDFVFPDDAERDEF